MNDRSDIRDAFLLLTEFVKKICSKKIYGYIWITFLWHYFELETRVMLQKQKGASESF